MTSDHLPPPALLKIEIGGRRGLVKPDEAIRIRDGLRQDVSPAAGRLAMLIDAKATELLAAPLYAGTVSVRMDVQEEQSLVDLLNDWHQAGSITDGDSIDRLRLELTRPD